MIKLNFSRPLMALTLLAMLGTAAAQAAPSPPVTKPSPPVTKASTASLKSLLSTVTMQTGEAMLEEYHGGNPGTRTTTIRAGETACSLKCTDSGKKHS